MHNLLIKFLFISITIFSLQANNTIPKKKTDLDITLSMISAMSETVHSLQKERGSSCGYISSNGKQFGKKLHGIKINT